MKKLVIIAIVAIFAASAFAVPNPPWGPVQTVNIPVIMDITPTVQIDLNNAVIRLTLSEETVSGTIYYEGIADPAPILRANVAVDVHADITALNPSIVDGMTNVFQLALRNEDYTNGRSPAAGAVTYDPVVIGNGIPIDIAVAIKNPDLTVRPDGPDQQVAIVTLTVTVR